MIPNILDFILLIFVIACFFLSSLRGGAKQIFSFVVIVISFMVASNTYGNIAKVLPEKVFPQSFAGTAGFVVVFLLVFGLISFVGRFLDEIFKRISFGRVDGILSRIVGIIKGVTLGGMAVVILMINYPADTSILTGSVACRYIIMPAVNKVATLLPQEEGKKFSDNEKQLKKIWEAPQEEEG